MSIQFTYDGPLPVGQDLAAAVPFTMTSGAVTLTSGLPGLSGRRLLFYALSADGAPSQFEIAIKEDFTDNAPAYTMVSTTVDQGTGGPLDSLTRMYYFDGGVELAYRWGKEGVWAQSAVPLPATVLLLGSGLIPLAWARRKKRLGK